MGTFGSDNGGYQKGNVVLDIIKGVFAALAAIFGVVIAILSIFGKIGGGGDNKA